MRLERFCCALVMPLGIAADASKAATGALATIPKMDYRYFVAGGTCAAISHGITTPIDVIKTKIQANPRKYNKGMAAAAIDIVKSEGPGALLAGLGPTVVGYGIEGAMKFGVYEILKPVFADMLNGVGGGDGSNTALAFLLASVAAGAVAALLLCPMESTRIKMVTDRSYKDKNLLTGLAKITSEEGVGAIFASLWAMLAKQVPYTFGKQVSFDVFAKVLYQTYRQFQDKISSFLTESEIKWAVSVVAAFLASLIACLFSQPGDMILTETYRPAPGKSVTDEESRKFSNVIDRLYKDGGFGRFFTGTGARIVHVGTIITSQLVIYDIVKQLLGLPATGSH